MSLSGALPHTSPASRSCSCNETSMEWMVSIPFKAAIAVMAVYLNLSLFGSPLLLFKSICSRCCHTQHVLSPPLSPPRQPPSAATTGTPCSLAPRLWNLISPPRQRCSHLHTVFPASTPTDFTVASRTAKVGHPIPLSPNPVPIFACNPTCLSVTP